MFFGIAFSVQAVMKVSGHSSEDSYTKNRQKKDKKSARSILEQEFQFEVNQSE